MDSSVYKGLKTEIINTTTTRTNSTSIGWLWILRVGIRRVM